MKKPIAQKNENVVLFKTDKEMHNRLVDHNSKPVVVTYNVQECTEEYPDTDRYFVQLMPAMRVIRTNTYFNNGDIITINGKKYEVQKN